MSSDTVTNRRSRTTKMLWMEYEPYITHKTIKETLRKDDKK